ncbi:hypothetical protein B0H17DRAFT_1092743, partial [Mycena rosella]
MFSKLTPALFLLSGLLSATAETHQVIVINNCPAGIAEGPNSTVVAPGEQKAYAFTEPTRNDVYFYKDDDWCGSIGYTLNAASGSTRMSESSAQYVYRFSARCGWSVDVAMADCPVSALISLSKNLN